MVAACLSSPAPAIYVLSHAVDSTMQTNSAPGGPAVQLQRVLVPDYLDTTDILLDAWALTTITDDLPGRPPVAQWLHGVEPPDQPTTSFAWREDVTHLAPKADDDGAAIQAWAQD